MGSCCLVGENLLDRHPEQPRAFEGQRQAGVELLLLDGVDRLPRHVQRVGKVRLGPVTLGA